MADRVRPVFVKLFHVPAASVTPASSPDTVTGWDSFGHLELVDALEAAFGIKLAPQDVSEMSTFGDVEKVIARYREGLS
jgi:acyl carrier protein